MGAQGRPSYRRYITVRGAFLILDVLALCPILLLTALSRLVRRPIDVGLGPLPIVNSQYHKKSLVLFGYSCETFTDDTWHMTQDFDWRFDRYFPSVLRAILPYVLYVFAIFRYRCLYVYFCGGPLRFTTLLVHLEPLLFNLAGIRTVVMPFGSDVHDLSRTSNLQFVAAMARDYPGQRLRRKRIAALIDTWTRGADYIIAGCDWVEYLYYWDRVMLSHFAIDTDLFHPPDDRDESAASAAAAPLRLLHAPNHRDCKGTAHLAAAVQELKDEGVAIELTILENVPNATVHRAIREADIVVDQLVIGWYAMFAIEAMATGKPVVCHIRDDLLDFYVSQGLVGRDELPLINASSRSIKDVIRGLSLLDRRELYEVGRTSRQFVERFHSLEAIGSIFAEINRELSLEPTGEPRRIARLRRGGGSGMA